MKILYITGDVPWPLNSGIRLRQYQILKSLANLADVDLLTLARRNIPAPEEINSLCQKVLTSQPSESTVGASRSKFGRLQRLWRELQGWPLAEEPPCRGSGICEMPELSNADYDIVWIERMRCALLLHHFGGQNVVLDLDDIEHRKIFRSLRQKNFFGWRYVRSTIEGRAWRSVELEALDRFGRVVVCSQEEREYLGKENVAVIPNCVPMDPKVKFSFGVDGRMLFVGLMSYRPNDEAMCYFVRSVLPLIRAVEKTAHLWIVGASPSPALQALADGRVVRLLGYVEEVKPYLSDAALSIAPIRTGSGTRIKILESLAAKTPVISTTLGAEGLELSNREHISLADGRHDFAQACVRLLQNRALRRKLAEAGYQQVKGLYGRSQLDMCVRNIVDDLVKNNGKVHAFA